MKKSILLFALICFYCSISIVAYAQTPNWQWAKSAGGTGSDYPISVVVDASGNSYVTGYFESPTITFGSYILTNSGEVDLFLAKYDANGNVLWAKSAGGTSSDYALSVAVDASGNTYMIGYFKSSTINFGTYTLTNSGEADIFLAKFDASGNVLWAKSVGGTSYDFGDCVVLDASGNIYVTGRFDSPTITFGSYTLTSAGSLDIFLAKFDVNGNVMWAKSVGGTGSDNAIAVAVDASGNTYVTGYFDSPTITVGSYTLANSGYYDVLLAKFDASGNVLWAKSIGGAYPDSGYAVAVDASGNSYVTGYYKSPAITFGTDTLTNSGSSDMFLAKYDASGNVLWAKSSIGTGDEGATSVVVDASGNAYVIGYFDDPTTFGSYILTSAGAFDIFLVKLDANGNELWAKSIGGANSDFAYSVAVDVSGNSYVTGYYRSPSIDFGSNTITNEGNYDIFLAKDANTNEIVEINKSNNISISPNPATDKLTIVISRISENSNLTIVNTQGQQIFECHITVSSTIIDVSNLNKGVYFLKVTDDKTVQLGKFVKQ